MNEKKAAIVGGGVIGGGWAARFLLNGWDVAVHDPDPEAPRKIGEVLTNARRSLPALYDKALPPEGALAFHDTLAGAVQGAGWIQESVSERLDLKHGVLAAISEAAPEDATIGSSTSGFRPSQLTERGARAIVAHPFNPVYLLPLVELSGDPDACARAADALRGLGMYPLVLRREIDAHIADRFLEAVWREALWLVRDGVASTEEVDEAIRMGFGLRWAQMGLFETYRVAGGEAGMRHFMAQFGPALEWPWTRLTDVPPFGDALVDLIAEQSDAQSGHMAIRDLERLRDDNLVGILRVLRRTKSGAGGVIEAHRAALPAPETDDPRPITFQGTVPASWTDYNGHMNESRYGEVCSHASDGLIERIGCDAAYLAAGGTWFTAETHVRYLSELMAGDRISARTQVLAGTERKMHLFHEILGPDGTVAATAEAFLLHVDLATRATAPAREDVAATLIAYAEAHAALPRPDGVGRHVGQRR